MNFTLDPRHGTHHPTQNTPARLPGSVRRTSSVDMLRPNGLDGELVLVGRARDLRTDRSGGTEVLAEASMRGVVDYAGSRQVKSLTTDPPSGGIEQLIGQKAGSGFRAVLNDALPGDRERRSPLFLLLDDIPVTVLISGHVLGAERRPEQDFWALRGHDIDSSLQKADLCAGWREGGTIMVELRTKRTVPVVTGPEAPVIDLDDAIGWHRMDTLPAGAMRRRRRLDVVDGPRLGISAMFRDSYVRQDGTETIIHEYVVEGSVDPSDLRILELRSEARVLPWVECPAAAKSAGRLAGVSVAELRAHVREHFLGTSTCTHLNDALRALEDITALAPRLGG